MKELSGRTVTGVISFSRNKILLVKRRTVVFKGYWALPGGKIDAEETAEQAVVREVKEETGLQVEVIRRIGEYRETGVQDGIEYDYLATCFLVNPIGGKIKMQEKEIAEIKIFSLRDVPQKLAFEHSKMLKDFEDSLLTSS